MRNRLIILSFKRRLNYTYVALREDGGDDWLCYQCHSDFVKFRDAIDNNEIPTYIPSVIAKDGTEEVAAKHGVDLVITPGASSEPVLIKP